MLQNKIFLSYDPNLSSQVRYNPHDTPTIEHDWAVLNVWGKGVLTAVLPGLVPFKKYEIKVYPRSKAMLGTPSKIVVAATLMDRKLFLVFVWFAFEVLFSFVFCFWSSLNFL